MMCFEWPVDHNIGAPRVFKAEPRSQLRACALASCLSFDLPELTKSSHLAGFKGNLEALESKKFGFNGIQRKRGFARIQKEFGFNMS
jgi:hypothetical protein